MTLPRGRGGVGHCLGRDHRGRPALFVGDIGDNQDLWPEVAVYRVTEPARLRDATVPAVRYRLRYPDGSRDAEALLVDPRTNRLYVATKNSDGGGLYRAPARLRTDRLNLLQRVTALEEKLAALNTATVKAPFKVVDASGRPAFSATARCRTASNPPKLLRRPRACTSPSPTKAR